MIVGHRGVGSSETTLEDFQRALDLGLSMVEFDLRQTKDKQIVVFHGPPGMEGMPILKEKTLAEITKELGSQPPLFSEVISLCSGKIAFDIEIKEEGILGAALDILPDAEKHLITSFLDPVVLAAKKEGLRSGLILGMQGVSLRQRLSELFPGKRKKAASADFLVPSRLIYEFAPERRPFKDALVWGVNDSKDMARFLRDPRVQGIITDYPEKAQQIERDIS